MPVEFYGNIFTFWWRKISNSEACNVGKNCNSQVKVRSARGEGDFFHFITMAKNDKMFLAHKTQYRSS